MMSVGLFVILVLSILGCESKPLSTPHWNLHWGQHPEHHNQITIVVVNDSPDEFSVCYETTWCAAVAIGSNVTVKTSTTYLFRIESPSWNGVHKFIRAYPGKHIYRSQDFRDTSDMFASPEVTQYVRVVSTELTQNAPKNPWLEELWRDAIRTKAFSTNQPLCLCGAGNESTLYSLANPNPDYPVLIDPSVCGCGNPKLSYDFLLPCNHDYDTPKRDMFFLTNCAAMREKIERKDEIRVHSIDAFNSRENQLCLKHRLWSSIKETYGRERAQFLMPNSYDFSNYLDRREFMFRTQFELEEGQMGIYIIKNPTKHRQKGLGLAIGPDLMKKSANPKEKLSFITEYLGEPFLFKEYKINLRQYVLLICTNGRLRGYAHRNSKIFYGSRKFVEPYISEEDEVTWRNNPTLMQNQVDSIITTGYLEDSFYDDKPMTVSELWDIFDAKKVDYSSLLKSMHTRLGLALHSVNRNISLPGSTFTTNACTLSATQTPECLKDAIRSLHIGCDFQIDKELTGYNSRLFECNRGPDMNSHNLRDGKMKIEVATDLISFLGINGPFDDSEENAKRHKLTKVYDSYEFNADEAFAYLESLRNLDAKEHVEL